MKDVYRNIETVFLHSESFLLRTVIIISQNPKQSFFWNSISVLRKLAYIFWWRKYVNNLLLYAKNVKTVLKDYLFEQLLKIPV